MLQVEIIFRHLLGTVGRMFRRVAISFGIVFLAAAAITEGVAAVLTKQFPPTGLTHVAALVIAFSWGLVVALAVGIEEGLRGFIHLIEDVVKATEKAALKLGEEIGKEGGQLLHAAEHEAQTLAHSAGNLVQGVERGASTAVRDVVGIPGRLLSGVEGAGHAIEQHLPGHNQSTPQQ